MPAYRWCGLTLSADLEFPELRATADSSNPSWRVTQREGRAPRRPGRRWFHRWRFPDGRRWVAFARDPQGYVLRFPDLADFDVRPSERVIDVYPHATTPAHTLRHLVLDQVLPLIVGAADRLAVHGSVVATPQGAVALLGYAGLGKSTLAATLGQRGCAVLSDDCCVIVRSANGLSVVPSYPGVRLNPDSIGHAFGTPEIGSHVSHYSQKRRVDDPQLFAFSDQPVPLARIYEIAARDRLEQAQAIAIAEERKRDALYALIDYTFHLDIGYAPRIRETFNLAADIVEQLGVRRLEFPWDLGASGAVADAIMEDR